MTIKSFFLITPFFLLSFHLSAQTLDDALAEILGKETHTTSLLVPLIPFAGVYNNMGAAAESLLVEPDFIKGNPAVTSVIDYTQLSFRHSNWIGDSSVESVMFTTKISNLGLGANFTAFHLPYAKYEESNLPCPDIGTQYVYGYYSEMVGALNVSYLFSLSDKFYGPAIGTNFKVAHRYTSPEIGVEPSRIFLLGDLGAIVAFNVLKKSSPGERKNVSVGFSLENIEFSKDEPGKKGPSQIAAGVSYEPIGNLLFSFGVTKPINQPDADSSAPVFGAGAYYKFFDAFALYSGAQFSENAASLSIGGSVTFAQRVELGANYTLNDLSNFSYKRLLSIELKVLFEKWAEDSVIQDLVIPLYREGREYYLEQDYEKAIRKLKECLRHDPYFKPASSLLELIYQEKEISEKVQGIYR